ncbi:MAG TPA: SAM-dependent methyltransferase [Candidatus Binatia bacterium]|nr:SAM-dependent methyltransferase [Candidatus Binatia bacterium]
MVHRRSVRARGSRASGVALIACAAALTAARAQSAPPSAAASPSGSASAAIAAAVAASDRSDADRALDAGRKPAEMLAFAGIAPGMKVADLGAGGGYTTELLARAVGPTGRVYSQNSSLIRERFAEKPWTERLAKPALANVVRVEREFDDPLPPDARDLDAVILVLFYHDTYWMEVDRAAMNRAIFRALRPGGVYLVVDHSAAAGSGARDVKTLHRVEESLVRSEIESAGFRLDGEADFLRNPEDARDWNDSPSAAGDRRGTSDRFVLRFVKPASAAPGTAPPGGTGALSAPTPKPENP